MPNAYMNGTQQPEGMIKMPKGQAIAGSAIGILVVSPASGKRCQRQHLQLSRHV